ncbi:UNVERIFIED_CONTAM: putative aldo-keto reductase 1 [Sesamum radiatum]|uniref:Aldo-keto reductase 1 n=1 Tax=Sesamum radiatum TaxID=300843 RepID=A0AAW2QHU0_SESRA
MDAAGVKDEFVQYFQTLLDGDIRSRDINLEQFSPWVKHMLTDVQATGLTSQVQREEVHHALMSIADDKAPGPDGYSVCFFKRAWPLIGKEVRDAVLELFHNGYNQKHLPPRCAISVDLRKKAYDKVLKELLHEQVQIASKFGVYRPDGMSQVQVKGSSEYVRKCIEASLTWLDVDYIDLYYQHRVDTSVPIEEIYFPQSFGSVLKKLVEEGKIRYIGLSEASMDTIKTPHAVHPITVVQMEELGIGIVAYSPLGHGFFGGKGIVEGLPSQSVLVNVAYGFLDIASQREMLVNLMCRGRVALFFKRTTKIKNMEANIGSLAVKLTAEDLKEIAAAIPVDQVGSEREYTIFSKYSYRFANTSQKK